MEKIKMSQVPALAVSPEQVETAYEILDNARATVIGKFNELALAKRVLQSEEDRIVLAGFEGKTNKEQREAMLRTALHAENAAVVEAQILYDDARYLFARAEDRISEMKMMIALEKMYIEAVKHAIKVN